MVVITQLILAGCSTSSAAQAADSYNGGGFTDWYLPSRDELHEAITATGWWHGGNTANFISGSAGAYGYWTSSEAPGTLASSLWNVNVPVCAKAWTVKNNCGEDCAPGCSATYTCGDVPEVLVTKKFVTRRTRAIRAFTTT